MERNLLHLLPRKEPLHICQQNQWDKKAGIRTKNGESGSLDAIQLFFPDVSIDQVDGFKDKIFKRDDLYRILDPSIISKSECKSIVNDLKRKVLRALNNDPSNANVQDIEFLFSDIQ